MLVCLSTFVFVELSKYFENNSICMDEFTKNDEMGQLECGHAFHKACIVEWLNNSSECPMCRADMKK